MMQTVRHRIFPLLLLLLPGLCWAQPVTVQNLRLWRAPDHTRLVFDLSGPLEHRLFNLQDPERIVIDMDHARLQGGLPDVDKSEPVLGAIRAGKPESDTLRIVLDLKVATKPRTFVLKPAGPYGHRLVIDLYDAKVLEQETRETEAAEAAPPRLEPPITAAKRDLVVAIDAGHGGEDPGAIGRRYRTREKDVTLAVARELARLVAATPGMQPVLTRDGDYYVGLRDRFRKALNRKADVFISIHADAMPGRKMAVGSSVYALAQRGSSDSISRFIAEKENAADQIGGVYLRDKDSDVKKVLVDLSQSKAIEYSLELAGDILGQMRRVGPTHMARPGQAGFMVLKSPDFPSVLVETAFLSNPGEEQKLRTAAFQRELAGAILGGVKRYFGRNGTTVPAPGPVRPPVVQEADAAPREHVVRPGETLANIARQYNVHIEALRFLNGLDSGEPAPGLHLRIPAAADES
jgi:N-acetylmuramoyl-L-alanine amidase